jgi:hypothetical protein
MAPKYRLFVSICSHEAAPLSAGTEFTAGSIRKEKTFSTRKSSFKASGNGAAEGTVLRCNRVTTQRIRFKTWRKRENEGTKGKRNGSHQEPVL